MNQYIVVCFAAGKLYAGFMRENEKTIKNLGGEFIGAELPDTGDWAVNNKYRPEFIYGLLYATKRNLLCIDADKTYNYLPKIKISGSMGFARHPNKTVCDAYHFWKPEQPAFDLLNTWIDLCHQAPEYTADHGPLGRAVQQHNYEGVTFLDDVLPPAVNDCKARKKAVEKQPRWIEAHSK